MNGETGRTLDEYLSRLERFGFTGGALAVRGKDVLLSKSYGLADRARAHPAHDRQRVQPRLDHQAVHGGGHPHARDAGEAGRHGPGQQVPGRRARRQGRDHAASPPDAFIRPRVGLQPDRLRPGRSRGVRAPRALQSTLLFKPGDGYEYSNAGYSLLAAIVEKVSGQPYEAYLTERVLKPAGHARDGLQAPEVGARPRSRTATATAARTGARSSSGSRSRTRRTGRCAATAGCTRRSATCSRGTARSTPTPCCRRTRGRSTSSRTSPRARAGCRTTPTAGRSSKSARGTTVVQHNGGNGIYVAEFLRFPDEDAMLFLTSTDTDADGHAGRRGARADPVRRQGGRCRRASSTSRPTACRPWPDEWRLPRGGTLTLAADGAGPAGHGPRARRRSRPSPPRRRPRRRVWPSSPRARRTSRRSRSPAT